MGQPQKIEPTHQAILDAVQANQRSNEEWQVEHGRRMGVMEDGLQHTNARLDEHVRMESSGVDDIRAMLQQHMTDSALWRQKNDAEMAENTALTKEYAEGRNFVRVGTSIIRWAGAVVLALGSIWWGVREMLNHHDITPGP